VEEERGAQTVQLEMLGCSIDWEGDAMAFGTPAAYEI
jgi:hypothetical protein